MDATRGAPRPARLGPRGPRLHHLQVPLGTAGALGINFGVFAGRHATPAEIDELAVALRDAVPSFAIVSEDRFEFGDAVAASVHQVVVEVPQEVVGEEPQLLAEQIVFAANGWALGCTAARHGQNV